MNAIDFLEEKRSAEDFLNAEPDGTKTGFGNLHIAEDEEQAAQESAIGQDPYDRFKVQEAAAAQAGRPLESYQASVPPSLNPDFDFTRATGGSPTLAIMGGAAKGVSKAVAAVAVPVINSLKQAMAGENAIYNNPMSNPDNPEQWGTADVTPIKEGVPMLQLPRLTKEEMEAATPTERAIAGVGEGLAGAYESLTTPENIALLPFGGAKAVQALFASQMAAAIPESLQQVANAKTPEDEGRAISGLVMNTVLAGSLTHSILKEGGINASQVKTPTEVHGNVRSQPIDVETEVSPAEGGAGVQPSPGAIPKTKVPLSDEASKLLAEHWVDDKHEFDHLGDGRFMLADHANDRIVVDPVEFQAWLDNDLKGLSPDKKAAAVKAMFEHEDIHLKTDPELGEPYWNSLSPFEKYVLKRQYLKGAEGDSAKNLGMEAIRNRVERAMGMTRSDFIGLALKEKWTAQSLDFLQDIVGKIRRLKSKELSASQNATLDTVLENIKAARTAVAQPGEVQKEEQVAEAPAAPEAPKAERTEAPAEALTEQQLDDLRGLGLGDEDIINMTHEQQLSLLGETIRTPGLEEGPFARRKTYPQSEKADDLLERAPGETTHQEVFNLSDEESRKFFAGNQKRGNATQHDSVLYGMSLLPSDVPELARLRDELHRVGMEKLSKAIKDGKPEMPEEFGKVIWMNGALEGAARKGPNFESVTARRRAEGPAGRRNTEKEGKGTPDLFGPMAKIGPATEEPFNRDVSDFIPTTRDLIRHQQDFLLSDRADELTGDELKKERDKLKSLMQQFEKEEDKPYGVQGPAARRKQTTDLNQEKLFGAAPITKKGIPGEESVPLKERASATQAGATEFVPEQKIFPQEIDFETGKNSDDPKGNMPVRPISPAEAKNATTLSEFLTEDARVGGSELPVSHSKRLTALFDKTDGTVHLVSTYRGDGLARMVDPELAGKERPSKPIDQMLHRYQPVYSFLMTDAKSNFHQKFNSMEDFQSRFLTEAKDAARERGTGFAGLPKTEMGQVLPTEAEFVPKGERFAKSSERGARVQQGSTGFRYPKEREPNLPRPEASELRAFHDFFGDNPPSDALMFNRRIEKEAAQAPRAMINVIRKLARIERANHRGLSEGEAVGRVIDKLYDNYQASDTRSEFIKRTTEQNRVGPSEEIPEGGAPGETGARELSTLRSRAPTEVKLPPPEVVARGEGFEIQRPRKAQEPPKTPTPPVEKLSPEAQEALRKELNKRHPPQFEVSPRTTLGKQVLETKVPKERYTVAASKSIEAHLAGDPELGQRESAESKQAYIQLLQGWLKSEAKTAPQEMVKEIQDALESALADFEDTYGEYKDEDVNQLEMFPDREVMSEAPPKPKGESLAQEKKVLAKAEGTKGQLDLFMKKQGPAARRRMGETMDRFKDYLKRTEFNISTAGNIADQLYRLKGSEAADVDLAKPVVKAWLKMVPEANRVKMLHYADDMQVKKQTDIKLTDSEHLIYDTFIKPLRDQNEQIFQRLTKGGVDVGDTTYLARMVQDPHSLYSKLVRGVKQRVSEGQLLGQYASFFRRRVFKAMEDSSGKRQLVALVGRGDHTKVIAYNKGKGELMGNMPAESMETRPLTMTQLRTQRHIESARLKEMDRLDKEETALTNEKSRLEKLPKSDENDLRLKGINDRLQSIMGDYADVAEKYSAPIFETPRIWTDPKGKKWHLTDATIQEIEGNTDTRFYKDPMAALISQNLKLKQIYRAHQFFEHLKDSEDFQKVSHMGRGAPSDWRVVDSQVFPQLRGMRIEPRVADELDIYAEEAKGPSQGMRIPSKVNSLIREAVFIANPFVHEPNLLLHWYTARGIEWLNPAGFKRMVTTGAQALHDVMSRSQFRDEAMRSGAPLKVNMKEMTQSMVKMLSQEMDKNKPLAERMAKKLGYANPLRMLRKFGDTLTWGTNEVLTLQLIRETMARTGLSLDEAVSEVGKHMPTYRVPARVLNSTFISKVMRSPVLSLWGRYRYGALKSYGEMGKEIFSPKSTMKERLEGVGRVGAIAFAMAVIYPAIDEIVNKVMGTKGLKMRRAGSTTTPQGLLDVAQGKRPVQSILESTLSPSPMWTAPLELAFNRNLRSGLPIYEKQLSGQTAKDVGSFALSQLAPIEQTGQVIGGHRSLPEFGLNMAGISRTRADSAISQFGRFADKWMKNSPDEAIREQYKRRTSDVFPESDYQTLRSAVIRQDDRAGDMAMDKLLKTRKPSEILQRINQWKHSPFTGTRHTDRLLMEEMTPEDLDLWYQAKQERLDISEGMKAHLENAMEKAQ